MSDVNLDFTVNSNQITFTPNTNDIIITPSDISLTLSTAGLALPGSPANSVQYNKDSLFTGNSNFTYIEGTQTLNVSNIVINSTASINNANLLNIAIANLHVSGGTNGYVMQTDGAGNLSWTAQTGGGGGNGSPGGANTQIQFNDAGAFGGNAGFTFNKSTGAINVPGNITSANASLGNAVTANYFIGSGANLINITGANVTGYVPNATHANIADAANSVAGANVTGQVANSMVAGTVYTNAQPNITSVGSLTSLTVAGNLSVTGTTSVYDAIENVAIISAQTGTYNFNMLDGSIQYSTPNAGANITLNFRGNSSVAANTMLSTGKSITSTYLMTNGATPYYVSGVQVDGTSATIKWVNGVVPAQAANSVGAYTFTIVKTASTPTYSVFGSLTRYL